MIIYGARPSPFVRKVIIFAEEKGLAVEVHPPSARYPLSKTAIS
jgi:glutathione S-transferase